MRDNGKSNQRRWLKEMLERLLVKEEIQGLSSDEERDKELYKMWIRELEEVEE